MVKGGKRKKPYLTRKYIQEKTAKERGVKRGEILKRHMPRKKSPFKLKIKFLKNGQVKTPFYEEVKRGKIKLKGYSAHKTAFDAIRATAHTLKSVGSELQNMRVAQENIAEIHTLLYDQWKKMNSKQKNSAKEYVFGLIDLIQPQRGKKRFEYKNRDKINRVTIYSPDKIKTVNRMKQAVELMEGENIGAARASIAGASNDLISRMNTLIAQEAFLRRRRKVIVKERVEDELKVSNIFDGINEVRERIGRPDMPPEILIQSLKNSIKGINRLTYKRFKEAREPISKAMNIILKRGSPREAKKALTTAMKSIRLAASESTIFSPERLKRIKEKGTPKARMEIVKNQSKLFGENAEYWFKKATPNQKKNMYQFLNALRGTLMGTRAQPTLSRIGRAEKDLKNKKFKECRENLLNVSKFIGKKLQKK